MLDQTHRFAGAFIIDTQQNLILQLRDNKQGIRNPGAVSVFGGAVEAGETYVDGLVRRSSRNWRSRSIGTISHFLAVNKK